MRSGEVSSFWAAVSRVGRHLGVVIGGVLSRVHRDTFNLCPLSCSFIKVETIYELRHEC